MAAFQKSAATIADYDAIAAAFDAGNKDHDVSQNIDALLVPLERAQPGAKLTVVDLGCAGGRDLVTFLARGCDAWGVEGSAFCELAPRRRAGQG
ncbi:methyltransferase domain-containing protein [Aureococcus anophagefferens]|nr:methyltransferase domain-containing protein [Aureococcus anophagefferens]